MMGDKMTPGEQDARRLRRALDAFVGPLYTSCVPPSERAPEPPTFAPLDIPPLARPDHRVILWGIRWGIR